MKETTMECVKEPKYISDNAYVLYHAVRKWLSNTFGTPTVQNFDKEFEESANDKVYVVIQEWKVDGVAEFEVTKVCKTRDDARECLKEIRHNIIFGWAGNDDAWEIETDNEDRFDYQYNDWQRYYIVDVIEKELC